MSAARLGLRIQAPLLDIPVFVGMGRDPGFFRRETAFCQREGEKRGAGQGCDRVERAVRLGIAILADRPGIGLDRRSRLFLMDDALRQDEARG